MPLSMTVDSGLAAMLWLATCALASLLLVLGLLGQAGRRPLEPAGNAAGTPSPRRAGNRRLAKTIWALASLVPLGVVAADFLLGESSSFTVAQSSSIIALSLLAVAAGGVWIGSRPRAKQACDNALSLGSTALLLLLLNAASLVYAAKRLHGEAEPDTSLVDEDSSELQGLWAFEAVTDVRGTTDRGRAVQLFKPPADVQEGGSESSMGRNYQRRMIELAKTDPRFNCHGWVFTGGRFLMQGSDVELVLEDNGYVAVTEPAPGDVAIYRTANYNAAYGDPEYGGTEYGTNTLGETANSGIEHTGQVKFVDNEGLVVVESKWGTQGRFLHAAPLDGMVLTFYRSSRLGHLLRFSPASHADAGTPAITLPAVSLPTAAARPSAR